MFKARETIRLYRSGALWVARFSDPAIKRLFGTDTIPTAYGACCDAHFVWNEVERRNPDCAVSVAI